MGCRGVKPAVNGRLRPPRLRSAKATGEVALLPAGEGSPPCRPRRRCPSRHPTPLPCHRPPLRPCHRWPRPRRSRASRSSQHNQGAPRRAGAAGGREAEELAMLPTPEVPASALASRCGPTTSCWRPAASAACDRERPRGHLALRRECAPVGRVSARRSAPGRRGPGRRCGRRWPRSASPGSGSCRSRSSQPSIRPIATRGPYDIRPLRGCRCPCGPTARSAPRRRSAPSPAGR